jgi:hypothetical protein
MRHTRRATWFYPDADRLIAELARDALRRRDRAWFLALVGFVFGGTQGGTLEAALTGALVGALLVLARIR